ncbi:MAG TPA: hypothetical protein VGC32_14100 [Solirubrobacterales bacterium]
MVTYVDQEAVSAAAEEILAAGYWCVIETCRDIPRQVWDRDLVVFHRDGEAVSEVVAEWVETMPHLDVRLSGCARATLRTAPAAPTHLCYLTSHTS